MKKLLIAGMLILPIFASASLYADEITDQINEGLKAYAEKDYKTAVEELKFVTAQLQKLDAAKNQKLLPAPLAGWTTEKVDNSGNQMAMSMLGGGSNMKARYTKKGEKETEQIDIEIAANSPILAMMTMMINNPAVLGADDSMSPYRYKKIKGIKKVDKNSTEITLSVIGQIMIKITGTKLKDQAVLEQYLDTIDIDKLKAELL